LKKKIVELEKKNKILEEGLQKVRAHWNNIKRKGEKSDEKHGAFLNRRLYAFSELFGGKKKRQEFENKVHELDEREKLLDALESKLVNEKKGIDEEVQGLREWREKLELLEDKIETRRKEMVQQENLLAESSSVLNDTKAFEENNVQEVVEQEPNVSLDAIPECAAVIQRGILKQVNGPFADMIGYDVNEIVDKSLFDFIVSEGFSEVEKFYLNRLVGEDVSVYETVLLAKDNSKICVEISTKPTFFNGEKAEIAVVKKIEKKKQENKN